MFSLRAMFFFYIKICGESSESRWNFFVFLINYFILYGNKTEHVTSKSSTAA